MPEKPLPTRLIDFVARHVSSVEQLEILCLLAEDPSKAWSTAEVLRNIQSSEKSVTDCLQRFATDGLLSSTNGVYRFAGGDAELIETVMTLVTTYRERRVATIEVIYRKPEKSTQSSSGGTERISRKKVGH